MPRRARVVVPGVPVHIIQRGHDCQPVFFCDDDYWRYLHDLKLASGNSGCAVHAYVLMTNHVHIVATPNTETSLGDMMRSLGARYVRFINLRYKRRGTLWEGRFRSAIIQSDAYLLTCYRYVELNPVRAHMVTHPAAYPWSSYHHNALGKVNELVQAHDVYLRLGSECLARQARYRALFSEQIGDEQNTFILQSTLQDSVMGNDRFRRQIEKVAGRKLSVATHGGARRSSRPPSP